MAKSRQKSANKNKAGSTPGSAGEGAERAARYETKGIRVFIDDWECDIVNVSDSGILINSKYLSFESGTDLEFLFIYPTNARPAKIILNGNVVRSRQNEFAVENIRPTVTWRRLLHKHIQSLKK
jgi:hypothetical protein